MTVRSARYEESAVTGHKTWVHAPLSSFRTKAHTSNREALPSLRPQPRSAPTWYARRDLAGNDPGVVVDGAALDKQALRQAGNLAVEARHQVVHGLAHRGQTRWTTLKKAAQGARI